VNADDPISPEIYYVNNFNDFDSDDDDNFRNINEPEEIDDGLLL
jgi:hypothetical protein